MPWMTSLPNSTFWREIKIFDILKTTIDAFNPIPIGLLLSNINGDGGGGQYPYDFALRVETDNC